MIRETQRTKETFVYCAVFIELIADSLERLQSKQIETQSILTHHKILVDKLYLRQLQGFESVKPNGKNAFGTDLSVFSQQAALQTCFLSPTPARMTKTDFTSAVTRTAATSL